MIRQVVVDTSAAGGFDSFLNGYAVVVFVVAGLIAFFGSYIRYGEQSERVQDVPGQPATVTRGSGTAGMIVAPILVGVVMLAFAVVFAVGS